MMGPMSGYLLAFDLQRFRHQKGKLTRICFRTKQYLYNLFEKERL
jgi:hypothetical protein